MKTFRLRKSFTGALVLQVLSDATGQWHDARGHDVAVESCDADMPFRIVDEQRLDGLLTIEKRSKAAKLGHKKRKAPVLHVVVPAGMSIVGLDGEVRHPPGHDDGPKAA